MQYDEASAIIKKNEEQYMNDWNMTRMNMYAIFQSQSTKSIKPTDVLKFPWDKTIKDDIIVVTQERRDDLIKKSKEMEDKLNKK